MILSNIRGLISSANPRKMDLKQGLISEEGGDGHPSLNRLSAPILDPEEDTLLPQLHGLCILEITDFEKQSLLDAMQRFMDSERAKTSDHAQKHIPRTAEYAQRACTK